MAGLLATGWDAVNRFRKIEEATAPRDDPAPGEGKAVRFDGCDRECMQSTDAIWMLFAVYLLEEIADMSRQSPEAATAIAEAVQKKLASKNPIVKFKAGPLTSGCCHPS